MAYVPPSKRGVVIKNEDFPSLGNSKPQAKTWKGNSFANLASDWQKKQDREELENALKQEMERKQQEKERIENTHFVFRRRRVEEEYDEEDEYVEEKPRDEWTNVEKKAKRILTAEEKYQKELERERQEKEAQEEFENGEDDKWDFRDRRIYS
jgi:hypothetical protein